MAAMREGRRVWRLSVCRHRSEPQRSVESRADSIVRSTARTLPSFRPLSGPWKAGESAGVHGPIRACIAMLFSSLSDDGSSCPPALRGHYPVSGTCATSPTSDNLASAKRKPNGRSDAPVRV